MVDPSGDDLDMSNRDVSKGVHRPPEVQKGSEATIVTHDPSLDGHPSGTTSHRFPRQAHSLQNHIINVGRSQDSALYVQLKFEGDLYDYYMPALAEDTTEYACLSGAGDAREDDLEKWKVSDLAEIKSIVCDNNVWDVRELPVGANLLTSSGCEQSSLMVSISPVQ